MTRPTETRASLVRIHYKINAYPSWSYYNGKNKCLNRLVLNEPSLQNGGRETSAQYNIGSRKAKPFFFIRLARLRYVIQLMHKIG